MRPSRTLFDAVRQSGEKIDLSGDTALANPGGLRVPIECCASPIRDSQGRFAGAVIVFRDVGDRRAAERALQSSEESRAENADALFEEKERAQVTLNSIGDAVVSTNFWGRVTYLNIVAERMTGWTQAQASGRAVDDVFRLIDVMTRNADRDAHRARHHRESHGGACRGLHAHPLRRRRARHRDLGGADSRPAGRRHRRGDGGARRDHRARAVAQARAPRAPRQPDGRARTARCSAIGSIRP